MPSGRRVTQLTSGSAQWRDRQGDWHDYDLSLRESGAGWTAQPGKLAIELPRELSRSAGGAISIAGAGASLEMTFLGGKAPGVVDDDVAVYRGVAEGVDLHLRALREGLKEDVVLRDRDASRDLRYRIELGSDDLTLTADRSGGLRVMRGKETIWVIPAPTLMERGARAPGAVGRFELREAGERAWEVTTVLPEKWLAEPGRAWPVTVDPSVLNVAVIDDCMRGAYISTATRTGNAVDYCNAYNTDWVGKDGGYAPTSFDYWEVNLRFNTTLTLVPTDAIDSASLKLYRVGSSTLTRPLPTDVKRIVLPWEWRGVSPLFPQPFHPQSYTDPSPYAQLAPGAAGPVSIDVTSLVDQWQRYRNDNTKGFPNYGLNLSQEFVPPATGPTPYSCSNEPCPWTGFANAWDPDPALHPVLEVTSWPHAPAGSAVTSPGEGDLTSKRVRLQARALSSSVTTARFQYIAGSQRRWTDVPLAALKTPTRGSVANINIPVSGPSGDRRSDLVVWDLSAMPGGDVDGPVHVRAWLESAVPGQGGMTDEVNFRLDRRGIGGSTPVDVGPGELDLNSGEFSLVATDAVFGAFQQDLVLRRTHQSRGVAVRNADMFGAGWEASVEADGGEVPYKGIYNYSEVRDVVVDRQVLDPARWNWELFFETFLFEDLAPDVETVVETERFDYEYAVVEAGDGTKMTFTQVKNGSGVVTDWTPDDLHPGFTLARATTGTTGVFEFTLTDPSGNVATFLSEAASSPNYRLTAFKQPGSPGALSYTYEAAGTRQRLRSVTAPNPTGGTTRSLVFTWSNVGTPATPRVTAVAVQDGSSTPVTVATYSYDANARLTQVTDPRVASSARNTRYHYDANGRLDEITPSGEATWNLGYTTVSGDAGPRLASIRRTHPDGGTATRTIRYDVPLSGGSAPYDMGTTETAKWGQVDDLPWDAVAVWPEDTVPNPARPDYSKATVYYVDMQGLLVNVARPGGAITTFEHDANGNVIRELGARGRAAALAAGGSSATVAVDRSTLYSYASNGIDLVATREPVTQITLSDGRVVTGRRLSTTDYDAGAPRGGPFHLPTSEWRAVESGGRQLDVRELVRYSYNAEGGMSGWTARHATKTVVDPGGRALTSYSILHGSYPIVEETRTPAGAGGGSTPDVQWNQYYGIAPTRVPAGIQDTQCRSFASYASGRLCMRSEATTPNASIPRRWFTYSLYGNVATLNESKTLSQSGPTFRSTTNTYNAADELTSVAVSGGAGTATPTTSYAYDAASGQETEARSSAGTITRTFDSNGRLATYTDAAGQLSTFRYDLRGRETSWNWVTTETMTFAYDDRDNRTRVTDPVVGSMTATYDLDDNLAGETLPNGLAALRSYDETGRPSLLTWTQTRGCSTNCVWVRSEVTKRDADGRVVGQLTGKTEEALSYDSAGRLTQSDAVRLSDNRCVRRTYAYDGGSAGDSDRTSGSVWTSTPGNACGSGSPVTRTHTLDDADRITSAGWAWDDFGRATAVPAADSGGSGALTASYYTDDRVREMTLDGRTHTYSRDPLRRTFRVDSRGAGEPTVAATNHYADDSDRPAFVLYGDGGWSRDLEGPSGLVVGVDYNDTISYHLRDVQGNVVARAPASGALTGSTEYDPFGIVTTAAPNVVDWGDGLSGNGWLGAHQRPTQFGQAGVDAAGPIEMGARVYLPKLGRFLQPDPIEGGSANAYDYGFQDPLNVRDLNGEFAIAVPIIVIGGGIAARWVAGAAAGAVIGVCLAKKHPSRDPIPQSQGHRPSGTGKKNYDKHTKVRPGSPEKGDARRPYRRK